MIQVLLLILKIIGITLLSVLGVILLVLAVVLFVPVFYRVRVVHNPKETRVTAKVSFLSPLLLATVEYLKKLTYKVRVFGFAILDSEKPKKEKKPKEKKPKKGKKKRKKPKKKVQPQERESEKVTWAPLGQPVPAPVQEEQPQEQPEPEITEEPKQEPEKKTAKAGFFEKIRSKIQNIRETIGKIVKKIRKLLHQKDEVQRILAKPETKKAISFAWEKLKRVLKHILPRKIKGYVVFGAGDPATTGQVLGVLSVLYARTGMLLEIHPDFTEKQLECDVLLKGRIQLFTLLVIAVKVFLNQELKTVIADFKGIKEIE